MGRAEEARRGAEEEDTTNSDLLLGCCPSCKGGRVEGVEHLEGGRPVDACVRDRDTVLERPILRHILSAGSQVRLDHHTGDRGLTGLDLRRDAGDHLGGVSKAQQSASGLDAG